MCEIRLAGAKDVNAIIQIGSHTFNKAYGDIVRPDDMATYLEKMFDHIRIAAEIADETAFYWVAERDDSLLAYAKLAQTPRPKQLPNANMMELVRLYVVEDEYGKGIGSDLLRAARSNVMASGCSGWWLRVWQKNASAIRLYERHGFKALGVEPYLIGETANPVVLMHEPL
ncbi:GNAT family N-acetyltransferase [Mariprofundus sp. EBB-1]|uniref:GNAT family N-acetyltransferase n=1 Tax=Mariprofundus sp. EBB-1 TaxID=2650971 RepID=UPI000EF28BFC|nr:GNAT family N-acetyltransferase [Mariprofundus sp. EBB-1]RLL50942.1 GNAT family N-acetyltransferase [Mariprofundus sp. EBB-1]